MSIVFLKQRRTIGLGEVSSLATSPNLTPRLCQILLLFVLLLLLRDAQETRLPRKQKDLLVSKQPDFLVLFQFLFFGGDFCILAIIPATKRANIHILM